MRDYLKEKTFIRFPGGECYEILGMIGEGGSGLIYSFILQEKLSGRVKIM